MLVSQCVSTMMRGRGRRRFVHCRLGQGERGLALTIVMGVLYLVALMEEEDLQKTQNKKKNEKNDNEKTKNEGRKLI